VQFFRHLDEWKLNKRHLFECSRKYTTVNHNLAIVFRNVVPPAWMPTGAWLNSNFCFATGAQNTVLFRRAE